MDLFTYLFIFAASVAWYKGLYVVCLIIIVLWFLLIWPRRARTYAAYPNWKALPDVSFWQGNIDWDVMHLNTDAVIIRAGQNLWADDKFVRNYSEAKTRGMYRGIYWFYDDRKSPNLQFDVLKGLIGDDLPEIGIFIDWESTYGGAYGSVKNIVAFAKLLEAQYPGVKIGIYTGYYWFIEHTNTILHADELAYLSKKVLWLAWYTADFANVRVPRPWTAITFWQYGTPALDLGQETKEIDMNYFIGTSEEFYEFVEGVKPMFEVKIVWGNGAPEREIPQSAGNYGDVLPAGGVYYADEGKVPDMDDPTNTFKRWIKLQSGWYIATDYPSGGLPAVRAIVTDLNPPAPTGHLLEVFVDGVLEYSKEF